MNKIKPFDGTHYRRRLYQPQHIPHECRELVSCLFCDTSSYPDDEEHVAERIDMTTRCKGVLHLDKLRTHIKAKHPECIPTEGRSLLGKDFTITGAKDYSTNVSEPSPVGDGHFGPDLSFGYVANEALDSLHFVGHARTTPPTSPSRRLASNLIEDTIATVERGVGMGNEFWRFLMRSLDGVIK
jgi:hypothetical protein